MTAADVVLFQLGACAIGAILAAIVIWRIRR
jgi:hypothetical protein